ncbi:MAG: restriction endonuclease subunit S, partial [Halothiobacillaceae bacterium]
MPSIPAHWNMVRAKNLASLIQTGPFGSQLHNHDYIHGGIPVVNPLHLVAGRIKPSTKARVSEKKAAELSRHKLQLGDIVFARRGDLGRSAVVTGKEVGWLCGTGSVLFRPLKVAHPEFISHLVATPMYKGLLLAGSVGSTMANLNPATFNSLPIPLPPRPEQDQIVAYLRAQDAHIARFIQAKRALIKLLTEQKLAIIDRAVTRGLNPNVRLKPSGIDWLGEVPEHWE